MRIEARIRKWGNSLALRVTGAMAQMPGFKEGGKVTVDVSADGIVVKPAPAEKCRVELPYSEQELIQGLSPETAHADALAVPTGPEWGD